MREPIMEGRSLGLSYRIYERTGVVEDSEHRSETHVFGTVGGGGSSPVSGTVQSTTTNFQTLFLRSDDGTEHAIVLVDLQIPCRAGHKLTALQLIPGRRRRGSFFGAYNHSLDRYVASNSALRSDLYPRHLVMLLMALVALWSSDRASTHDWGEYTILGPVFIAALSLIPAFIVLGPLGAVIGRIRAFKLSHDAEFKRFLSSLRDRSAS
jgi:hypothetical protein